MRFLICTIISLVHAFYATAQINLVPNSSFEIDTACPNSSGQLYYAPPWFQASIASGNTTSSCDSELFDECVTSYWNLGIPHNQWGFQEAHSGHAYAGFVSYMHWQIWHEYLEVPLISPLLENREYCVEFFVSLSENSPYAISNVGAFFSSDSLLDDRPFFMPIDTVVPQVENPVENLLTDTMNWIRIGGQFTAKGGERFLTIGNFHLPENTNFTTAQGNGLFSSAYYFIDDISVIDCDSSSTSVFDPSSVPILSCNPNPTTGYTRIDFKTPTDNITLVVYNEYGEVVHRAQLHSVTSYGIELPNINGVYIVRVIFSDGKHSTLKVVKE